MTAAVDRAGALRDAELVSVVTVAWSLVAGALSLGVGLSGGSLALGGLGADVLVDVISSVVLIRRFRRERAHAAVSHTAEYRAGLVAASGLLLIGVVLLATGVDRLVMGSHGATSVIELVLAGLNVVVLPSLGRWKYRVAEAVSSLALRTDSHITMVGAGTAALTLVGLGVDRIFGLSSADTVAALVIGVVALVQGRRSLLEVRAESPDTV